MNGISVGFALCGSFCTFRQVIPQIQKFTDMGAHVTPIMSDNAYNTDTRFGSAQSIREEIESICGRKILHTLTDVEPLGPKRMLDLLIIAPCTGNTLGKLSGAVSDTSVTLAAKAHLRNARPLLIAVSTNDALAGSAQNIGKLLQTKHIFFCPMRQDDPIKKPTSIVADFTRLPDAAKEALQERQIQPLLV